MRRVFTAALFATFVSLQAGIAQQATTPPGVTPAPAPQQTVTTTTTTTVTSVTVVNPDAQGRYTLREGEDVPLTFDQEITSKKAKAGDPVAFVLAADLKVGDVVVARAGAKAVGEVTEAEKNGMVGQAGSLNIQLDHLEVGESKVLLRGTKVDDGKSKTGRVVVMAVVLSPISLVRRGKNADIKKGQALTAYVAEDTPLLPAPAVVVPVAAK
jgi:hypothetical protein